ncbi:MAG TPA: hypothetical protein PLZ69_02510, partial [Candidatus Pacearchaeota archaeon]|nr:hypothetical protein [Candidatus Pacearchaeota archaeon]
SLFCGNVAIPINESSASHSSGLSWSNNPYRSQTSDPCSCSFCGTCYDCFLESPTWNTQIGCY